MKRSILYAVVLVLTTTATGVHAQNQEPMALGVVGINEVLKEYPIFNRYKTAYKPDAGAVDFLKAYRQQVAVKVFLGTWCIDSIRNEPAYLKVKDMLGDANFKTTYIGVNRERSDGAGMARAYNVTTSPVFVFEIDGKEVGRITRRPNKSIEEDLVEILRGR
jgi:hypothetical protein